jgi:hypothetical protein
VVALKEDVAGGVGEVDEDAVAVGDGSGRIPVEGEAEAAVGHGFDGGHVDRQRDSTGYVRAGIVVGRDRGVGPFDYDSFPTLDRGLGDTRL